MFQGRLRQHFLEKAVLTSFSSDLNISVQSSQEHEANHLLHNGKLLSQKLSKNLCLREKDDTYFIPRVLHRFSQTIQQSQCLSFLIVLYHVAVCHHECIKRRYMHIISRKNDTDANKEYGKRHGQ